MSPEELMNFSIYDFDLDKFGGSFENVRSLITDLGLDGIELLINFDPVPEKIPKDLVKAVHLPSFMGWVRIWRDENFRIPNEIEESSIKYFYGGRDRDEIVSNFCECLCFAKELDPSYGVFHATYTEVESAFSEKPLYSDKEILQSAAEFLNEAASRFPGGETPFPVYIENLWYPGLKFLDSDLTLEFMDNLEFKNWKFLLDTGHMMNATKKCCSEEDSIVTLLECLEKLDSEIIRQINGMHLQLSTSGDYQKSAREPDNYPEADFNEKYSLIISHLKKVDEHRPFSSEACRDIADYVSPEYVTHELQAYTGNEIKQALIQQITAFRKNSQPEQGI